MKQNNGDDNSGGWENEEVFPFTASYGICAIEDIGGLMKSKPLFCAYCVKEAGFLPLKLEASIPFCSWDCRRKYCQHHNLPIGDNNEW